MKIYYDTEFIEDGRTIDLISIGMAREDGAELYLINGNVDRDKVHAHEWLMANVVPSLPLCVVRGMPDSALSEHLEWNWLHPDADKVFTPWKMRDQVRDFILGAPDPQLWAWYAAYDHVALCQLWGPMMALPKGVPMWTNDLKQECERLGNPELPSMPGVTEHNALSDAREVAFRHRWLMERQP